MIRLTLFGGLDLVGPDGRSIQSVLEQPKRLALLIYLVLAGPGTFRSRDAALALFWPESDQDRARRALNQALHVLRRSLGADVILSRGSGEVGIAEDVLQCDAATFNQSMERGEAAEALRLYRGDLLPGFFVDGAPDFEQWLDEQRNHYRRMACRAARDLAESAERDDQLELAVEYARRSLDLSSDDETSLQHLLRLLDRIGDRAGALQAYALFAARFAKEYEADPSTETQRLIAQIRSRTEPDLGMHGGSGITRSRRSFPGEVQSHQDLYRLAAGSRLVAPETDEQPTIVREHPDQRRIGARFIGLLALVIAASGMGIMGFAWHARSAVRSPGPQWHVRVVVDPFSDLSVTPRPDRLGDALTAAIVDRLVRVGSFSVLPGSVSSGRTRVQPVQADDSYALQLRVVGTVLRSNGRVRANLEVADATSGRVLKTAVLEHDAGEELALLDTLSQQAASLVRVVAGREVQQRGWSADGRSERARDLIREASADEDRARELERSGALPATARALANADSLLRVAEALVPAWKTARIERARLLEWRAQLVLMPGLRDSSQVEPLLRQGITEAAEALSLDHRDASALETLGSLSYWYWLVVPMPPDSAERVLARGEENLRSAVTINPHRSAAWNLLSAALYSRADFAGAYLAAHRAYQANAYLDDAQEILSGLFLNAYEIGDDAAARHWCDEIDRNYQGSWTSADCRLSLLAWHGRQDTQGVARAWRIATEADRSPLGAQVGPRLHMLVAAILARSGLPDSADAVIRRARAQSSADPELLPLEAHARLLLGQSDSAVALLTEYLEEQPLHRAGVIWSRRFASLRAQGHYDLWDSPPEQALPITAHPLR